ncbi:hypothetical protein SASPL_136421 [Salvia splendens]|uniref:COMM domain-containing protein n=1 Tax=Salvia splendens TaxID=180675 RepID=A0A8X8WZT6_SALSN|nr:hypothetical protein SASPL_136421 [Salvia splendens]
MWGHLPMLVRASSKESVEYILQALWRTRLTGLDATDRRIFRDILQLSNDSDLDPVNSVYCLIEPFETSSSECLEAQEVYFLNFPSVREVLGRQRLQRHKDFRHICELWIDVKHQAWGLLVCLRVLIRRCVYDNVNKDEIHKLFPAEVLPELQRLLTLLLQKFQREWQQDISKDQVILPRLKSMTWNMANQSGEQTGPAAVMNLQLHSDAQPGMGERDVKFLLAKDTMEMMLKSMYSIRDELSEPDETPE